MKVVEMTTRAFWKGEFGITGCVEDEGQRYKVNMDVRGSEVNNCSCSCAQGISYKGMCPHAQELLTHYRQQEKEGAGTLVSTSAQVRTMIREYTNREVAALTRALEEEPVEFLPVLLLGREDVRAEFKTGRGRYYVVKDLVAFAQAVEHGSFVEYGRNLGFHHSLDIFTAESRPLVTMVMEAVSSYREEYDSVLKMPPGAASLRNLKLGKAGRDRMMELVLGREMEVEDSRGIRRQVTVRDQNPEFSIKVRKAGKDGLKVSVDRNLISFKGETYLYLLSGETLSRCEKENSRILEVFFEQMTQGFGAPYEVFVGARDIPLFYERVLKKLEPLGILDVAGVDLEAMRPVELKASFLFDSPEPGVLTMRPTLSYGEYAFHPVEDDKLPRTVCRDVPGEFRISQVITKYFKYREAEQPDLIIKDDDDALYQLLEKGMEEFKTLGEVYVTDSAEHFKVLPSPGISLGVTAFGNWLDISIDAGSLSGAELQKILSEYRRKKPYYRLKSGEFIRLDDNGFLTAARMLDGLELSKGEIQNKNIQVPKYRALYLDSLYKEYGGINFYRDQLFKSLVREMKSVEDSDYAVPASLQPVLRGYQKTGFRWLKTLDACGFGGILADDMGLGKTIQIISLLLDEKNLSLESPRSLSLIICPASLVYNWECEIHTFAPELSVLAVTGNGTEREEKIKKACGYDVLITSYDLLKRDIGYYEPLEFAYQVIDEAQYIKNPATQSARSVKLIHARTRFALTGTPIENRLGELWSIFDYLMPGFLFSYQKFKTLYEVPIVKEGNRESLSNLRRMSGPFILRRLKNDVLKELPEKLETVVYSRLEEEQRRLYTAHALLLKKELEGQSGDTPGAEKIQILSQLTRLRQLCCDPRLCYENYRGGSAKLETCMELLSGAVSAGHKTLLFSQFTSMLDLIGERLENEGIRYHLLTGATKKEDRLKMVNQFHKDDVPVFLISLKAGGTGLNLTAADVVIHYDPWWNVAAQNQATDRTHRIGQEKQVSVFKLITKDTLEENIVKLQDAKQNLAEQIITEGTVSLGSLSREELLKLLS